MVVGKLDPYCQVTYSAQERTARGNSFACSVLMSDCNCLRVSFFLLMNTLSSVRHLCNLSWGKRDSIEEESNNIPCAINCVVRGWDYYFIGVERHADIRTQGGKCVY